MYSSFNVRVACVLIFITLKRFIYNVGDDTCDSYLLKFCISCIFASIIYIFSLVYFQRAFVASMVQIVYSLLVGKYDSPPTSYLVTTILYEHNMIDIFCVQKLIKSLNIFNSL